MQIPRKLKGRPRLGAPLAREGWQVRKRAAPLARERRNRPSESTVFYRLLFRPIAPFPGPSALQAPILDRGADSGGGAGCPPRDAKVHGDLRYFRFDRLHFLGRVVFSARKVANGTRGPTETQRRARCFQRFYQAREIIRANIYVCIY